MLMGSDSIYWNPASFGPMGKSKRLFTFSGGTPDVLIQARSEQQWWHKAAAYLNSLPSCFILELQMEEAKVLRQYEEV